MWKEFILGQSPGAKDSVVALAAWRKHYNGVIWMARDLMSPTSLMVGQVIFCIRKETWNRRFAASLYGEAVSRVAPWRHSFTTFIRLIGYSTIWSDHYRCYLWWLLPDNIIWHGRQCLAKFVGISSISVSSKYMETVSTLLLCDGNRRSPVESPHQRPIMQSFDVFVLDTMGSVLNK